MNTRKDLNTVLSCNSIYILDQRERETDRQTDRHRDTETDRDRDIQTDRQRHRQTETERETDRQTDRVKDRDRQNSNSKTLFYKDCRLGTVENLPHN